MKNDQYRKARGGWSRTLEITCEKCETPVCRYQKDGPGPLKRMYLDRIIGLQTNEENLTCLRCDSILGLKIVYEKENRPAYRLFQDSVKKRVIKA